jgi:hypothetical protein
MSNREAIAIDSASLHQSRSDMSNREAIAIDRDSLHQSRSD